MKLNDNNTEVIIFIEDEMSFEGFLEKIFSADLSDEVFEKRIFEYVDLLIIEVAKTLHIDFEEAKDLYDEYLTRNILDVI
jgi:hypothetical protein